MLLFRRKFLFLIFLSCITVNSVLCGETDDVSAKNEKLDSPSAEVAEERDSVQSGALELEHEVINEQADQPTSGERFVAIHVGTLGMREELSPTLLGITHLVLTFLPAEYQLLTVISAAREVVAGVRYILVVNAERVENGERVVCSLEILEKPWITTEWGDKWRMLEGTNCTGSPNPLAPVRDQYRRVNPVFGGDKPKELTGDRLREVEDQIITSTTPRDFYEIHDTTTELPVAELSDEMKALLDAYYLSGKAPSGGIVRENVGPLATGVKPEIEPKIVNCESETEEIFLVSTEAAEASSTPLSNEVPQQQMTPIPQDIDEDFGQQQQILDPFFTIDPTQASVQEVERQKRELGRTEKEESLFLLNRALEQLDAIDEDASKKVAIEIFAFKEAQISDNCKIISAHAKVANSQCDENDENVRECMENVHAETAKLCAIEASICDGKSVKLKKSQCKPLPDKKVREKRDEELTVKGGRKEIDITDASHPIHELVRESLAGLGTSENGDVYSLVKINRASQQTVEGSIFRVNLDVKDADSKTVTCNLEVWDRPWLDNPKETKFDCDNSKKYKFRRRRSADEVTPVLVGGPSRIENFENDEKIKSLVQNSLVSFNEKEGNSYELHRIVGASHQVVAGSLYKIQVEFKRKEPQEIVECELSIWERSWLNSRETEVTCNNDKKYKFRKRRSADELPVLGGPRPIKNFENDEKVKSLVQNSLVSFNEREGNNFELHRIVGATHQVVAGSIYKIQVEFKRKDPQEIVECELSVLEKLGDDKSETEVSCNNDKKYKFRKRRSADEVKPANLPVFTFGGATPIENFENDEKVKSLVQNSLVSFNEKEGNNYELHRIVSATYQVVAGSIYKIQVEFKRKDPQEIVQCELSVLEKLGDDKSETDVSCNNDKKYKFRKRRSADEVQAKPPVLGGTTPIENFENDEKVKTLVQNSLVSFNEKEGNSYELHRIVGATHQVVAGSLYKIQVEFKRKDPQEIVECELSIWERSWMNSRETEVTCNNDKKYKFRKRRSADEVSFTPGAPGSPRPIENFENDEKVKGLVQNSLVSFNEKEGNSYELHRIVGATHQVVAGSLYKIQVEFKRKDPHEIVECELSVYERSWEQKSETDVSCNNDKKYKFRSKRSLIYDHRRRTEDYEEEEKRLMHQRETLAHHEELFHKFQLKFSRAYHSSMEKSLRFRIFQNNLAKIQMLNEREMGTAKYGVTEFADLTPTEYRLRTGLWKRNLDENHISNPIAEIPNFKLPKSFDWRDKNVVSEVKNQGNCGSCWAFSVTGNIEGLHAIKTGQLEEYSEQELLDCDAIDGGCAGGLPDNAYKAIEELGGLELESDYPYRARKSECVFNKTMSHVKVSGAVDFPKNETAMQLWLVQNGPISIGINANAMQFYRGGVSHPWRPLCRHSGIDHGVLIVGYGVAEYPLFNKTLPYWIVKNSWGPKWGEQGYYRVFRGDNTCGINSMASSAVLA
ncbi:uncharacterized protein LOC129798262 isoform X3 [Phlebotomus papatasi]|uniref:uncharacterized protein LOC129798262 isoform X3 n=1 Tax=Phlebotomus papatasi TaxID=29031 RepID=UPI0024840778|nr:uncharacterized protein LOC129798262 isoform X3 [Phlebotomus papatasi]